MTNILSCLSITAQSHELQTNDVKCPGFSFYNTKSENIIIFVKHDVINEGHRCYDRFFLKKLYELLNFSVFVNKILVNYNKKAQLSLTNPRDACEKFARFT